ncbi:hypothetical protein MASR1M12_12230 [Erysipelotrichia bacterium]
MLKKLLLIFMAGVIALPVVQAEPIMVDTRLMLLAHPLFTQFDPQTARFRGTSSEFVEGGQEGVDQLVAEIRRLDAWLLASPKHLQEKLKNVPVPDRAAAERAFLAEKREVESRLAMLQIRAYNARLVPGRPGVTPEASTMPQINEIAADIRAVLRQLKETHKTDVIIDSAELLPIVAKPKATPPALSANLHARLWKDPAIASSPEFAAWLDAADSWWAGKLGLDASVIPVGARDVRLEAVKLIEERTKGLKK